MVWWIASWDEDEQLQGKNILWRRGVLVLGGCEDGVDPVQDELPPTVVASPIYRGLVLFPNIEREGIPQWPI